MYNYKIGQNFIHKNEKYKIKSISSNGIECLNLKTGKIKIYKFMEFVSSIKKKDIQLQ
jgi:hypothetical protein